MSPDDICQACKRTAGGVLQAIRQYVAFVGEAVQNAGHQIPMMQ